jgi:predicted transcriptional regulator
MKKIIIFLSSTLFCYALSIGETLPNIVLDKANGGSSQGKAWHSSSLKGKVHTLLYMDPDKRDDNKLLLDALHKLKHKKGDYTTVAIVNLAATWMPNMILEDKLKSKQKELKNMEYVFDKKKYLVQKWHLKDDASNVFVLDKQSQVIYAKSGKLTAHDVIEILNKINKEFTSGLH